MFVPQSWITDVVAQANPQWSVTPAELDAGLNRVGFETEEHAPLPAIQGPLVLGIVEQIEELTEFKKPIRYCQVNVGQANGTGELQGIICGARNFAEGDMVIVALPGAELPGGFKISARQTYGHISNGMICSAAELGLTASSAGIQVVEPTLGQPGDDALGLVGSDDELFEVNITPDRGYGLSLRGLGREVASAFGLKYADPVGDVQELPVDGDAPIQVKVDEETQCVRFGVRTVTGIDPKAVTPWAIQRRLYLAGQRPVNVPTDVTNYVMFTLGLPMHAFDAEKITGDLHVRNAKAGEQLTTLDDVTRKLSPEDVVICDDTAPQSLAGVMGGTTSEIGDNTTDVHFEAAVWNPTRVFRTGRRHKLSSEASRRYERKVDATLVEKALDMAAQMLVDIAGGTIHQGRTLVGDAPAPAPIKFAENRPSEVAGVDYAPGTTVRHLEEVGCTISDLGNGDLEVTPPTWRLDLTMGADLVEEVLRLEGLDSITPKLPAAPAGRGLSLRQRRRRAVGYALAHAGYLEILPTPFTSNAVFDQWGLAADDPRRNTVKVLNPLESDYGQLGTTLLPAMMDALKRNVARGQTDVELYGVEQVAFSVDNGQTPILPTSAEPSAEELAHLLSTLPHQPLHVATIAAGNTVLNTPWGKSRPYGLVDAIEAARTVARAAGVELELRNAEVLPWHPGRCAELLVDGHVVGHAGELHPKVLVEMGLPERTCAMEIDLDALPLVENLPAPVLSPYPAVNQDVAVVVSEDMPAAKVEAALRSGAGELLEEIRLFDIYRSEQLGADKKSLAFALRFRAGDRTLTEDEASEGRLAAIKAAEAAVGAEVRG
ncbi:phenylalanine--tRNA ligase subunit beta [Corynebacterium ulceribovis]|uniref:phenylalanine--tRNA ligase subunit beta n=1 Tax=Corynebacterium ulceribovis TaxID=487732 RepID=UPI0003639397|nr:phenylalanine--tRNA ligase subunit beta [Corynebacterium ulceribovis]